MLFLICLSSGTEAADRVGESDRATTGVMHPASRLLKKSASSTRWLARQSSDPYVRARTAASPSLATAKGGLTGSRPANANGAPAQGFRARSSFKLVSICEKYPTLLSPDSVFSQGIRSDGSGRSAEKVVVDLGSAPGGWSQVARQTLGRRGKVFALDINAIDPLEGVRFIQGDFLDPAVQQQLRAEIESSGETQQLHGDRAEERNSVTADRALKDGVSEYRREGFVDTVLSDLMAPISGVRDRDVQASLDLVQAATDFARTTLKRAAVGAEPALFRGQTVWPGGNFV